MSEKYMIIDGIRTAFTDEKNILQVIRKAGIHVPTFCYYTDMSIYGACRMCVVEDERGSVIASCSTPPKHKMVIRTNTSKLHQHRKMILELLLASHCRDCTVCEKNGNCRLQMLAARFHLTKVRFPNTHPEPVIDDSSLSIVRDPSKCILCGDCVRMCNEVQHVGAIDFAHRGANMIVSPAFGRPIAETDCVNCGQCAAVCPTAAITIKKDLKGVWQALYAPNKRVVVQIAPAVRVAVGDNFGIPKGENCFGKLVSALRIMGFDMVFDTSFGADLTVMEESKEFAKRLASDEKLPLFTSCCPGWVKYCEEKYPEFADNLSTCRSPQGMFSAVIKDYFAEKDKEDGKRTMVVSIMPCTAKKGEILRPDNFTDGRQDTDYVITTTEVVRMIKQMGLQFTELENESADAPFSVASGAGKIFGTTGGVTEAVLRRLAEDKSYNTIREISYTGVRGFEGTKEATIELDGREVKIAVVHGLANAGRLLDRIRSGEASYDFVEVMECRRGCIMGGGQPSGAGPRTRRSRMEGMYNADASSNVRFSEENPAVRQLYDHFLAGKEHRLLHRNL